MPGIRRRPELPFVAGDNPVCAHQLGHSVFATGLPAEFQVRMNPGTAVGLTTALMHRLDLHE